MIEVVVHGFSARWPGFGAGLRHTSCDMSDDQLRKPRRMHLNFRLASCEGGAVEVCSLHVLFLGNGASQVTKST